MKRMSYDAFLCGMDLTKLIGIALLSVSRDRKIKIDDTKAFLRIIIIRGENGMSTDSAFQLVNNPAV